MEPVWGDREALRTGGVHSLVSLFMESHLREISVVIPETVGNRSWRKECGERKKGSCNKTAWSDKC